MSIKIPELSLGAVGIWLFTGKQNIKISISSKNRRNSAKREIYWQISEYIWEESYPMKLIHVKS